MAINRLGNTTKTLTPVNDADDDMKPLVREYGKEYPEIYNESHQVISGRISKSGVWCMLETAEYVLLIKASSSAVQELYNDILPQVHGKQAAWLVVEPVKKDRYGGCIGVDSELHGYYDFDEKSLEFSITDAPVAKTGKKQQSLSIEMFLDTTKSSNTSATQAINTAPETSLTATTKRTRIRKPSVTDTQEYG